MSKVFKAITGAAVAAGGIIASIWGVKKIVNIFRKPVEEIETTSEEVEAVVEDEDNEEESEEE